VLFVLADRYPRRWFIAGGLGVMAAASFAAALAPSAVALAIAISIWFLANGIAVALAQATLVDRSPDHRARTMTRWTLCALAGDLAAPLVLAASHMFAPVALALPFAIGLVADHAGTYVALALLVVQPLGLMALARSRDGVRSSAP
jgi:MFS family permease